MNDTQQILEAIKNLEKGQKRLEVGQERTNKRLGNVEAGQKIMQGDITSIKDTVKRIDDKLETGAGSSLDEENALKAKVERQEKKLEEHIRLSHHH